VGQNNDLIGYEFSNLHTYQLVSKPTAWKEDFSSQDIPLRGKMSPQLLCAWPFQALSTGNFPFSPDLRRGLPLRQAPGPLQSYCIGHLSLSIGESSLRLCLAPRFHLCSKHKLFNALSFFLHKFAICHVLVLSIAILRSFHTICVRGQHNCWSVGESPMLL